MYLSGSKAPAKVTNDPLLVGMSGVLLVITIVIDFTEMLDILLLSSMLRGTFSHMV